ncbi:MAG: hypothetical protein WBH73_01815 [Arcanobacterium sp.]
MVVSALELFEIREYRTIRRLSSDSSIFPNFKNDSGVFSHQKRRQGHFAPLKASLGASEVLKILKKRRLPLSCELQPLNCEFQVVIITNHQADKPF